MEDGVAVLAFTNRKSIAGKKHDFLNTLSVHTLCIRVICQGLINMSAFVVLRKTTHSSGHLKYMMRIGMCTIHIGYLSGFVKSQESNSKNVCFNLFKILCKIRPKIIDSLMKIMSTQTQDSLLKTKVNSVLKIKTRITKILTLAHTVRK